MWLLNLDKKVNLTLEKNTYQPWDSIRGVVSFDFWLETIKLNNITVTLRKKVKKEVRTYSNWSYSYSTETITTNILSKKILEKGEYRSKNLKFELNIWNNVIPKVFNFDKQLDNFLEKIKIKGVFKDFIKLIISFLWVSSAENPIFEIEARLDIPWGRDVVAVKQIDIYESREQIENEKELLTEIAKEEWIYNDGNKEIIDKMWLWK